MVVLDTASSRYKLEPAVRIAQVHFLLTRLLSILIMNNNYPAQDPAHAGCHQHTPCDSPFANYFRPCTFDHVRVG
jgi:hypothetical protein